VAGPDDRRMSSMGPQEEPKQQSLPFDSPEDDSSSADDVAPLEAPALKGAENEAPDEQALGENKYEERIYRRRERLEAAAAKARANSDEHFNRSSEAVEHIPLGQPILRGHHSEQRHRRDVERSHRAMDRSVAEAARAAHLEYQASRVGKGGISADDPAAREKLMTRLHELEQRLEMMKRVNLEFRRGGWDAVTGLSESSREQLKSAMSSLAHHSDRPFPPYALKNLGANIRRVRARIEELSTQAEHPERDVVKGLGYTLAESREDNRIRFTFDGKPKESIRSALKREGFRWARSVGAWQRQTTAAGWAAAERVRHALDKPDSPEDPAGVAAPDSAADSILWVRVHGRDEVIARIRKALNERSDRNWSVTGGRGTSHGWLHIDAPPKRRTFDHRQTGELGGDGLPVYELNHVEENGYLMGPEDRAELARLLGFPDESSIPHQGVKVPAGHDFYAEFIDRAEGRTPSVIGKAYWD